MRLKLILCLLVMATLSLLAVADEADNLILDLKDEGPSVRWRAAWALGATGDPRAVDPLAVDPLILALNDSDSDV